MTARHRPGAKPFPRLSVGDLAPAAAIAVLTAAATVVMLSRGIHYDGSSLSILFAICGGFAATALAIRIMDPAARIAMGAETLALFVALNLLSMLTASAFAVSDRPLIDPLLNGIDRAILPWISWRAAVDLAVRTPGAMALLSNVYASLTWQPALLVGAAIVLRDNRVLPRFNAAWAIGLLLCILPFYWLPAMGPYPWFGLTQADVPGHAVALPFKSGPLLAELRSGAVWTIGIHQLSGLDCCPSFHACGAVLLGWSFRSLPYLRWPMGLLNAAMLASTVPIGGHYFIDVIVGAMAGVLAILASDRLFRVALPLPAWPAVRFGLASRARPIPPAANS